LRGAIGSGKSRVSLHCCNSHCEKTLNPVPEISKRQSLLPMKLSQGDRVSNDIPTTDNLVYPAPIAFPPCNPQKTWGEKERYISFPSKREKIGTKQRNDRTSSPPKLVHKALVELFESSYPVDPGSEESSSKMPLALTLAKPAARDNTDTS